MRRSHPDVQGFCPACGKAGLVLGEDGHVTCTQDLCPRPDALSILMHDGQVTHHVVSIGNSPGAYTLKHPIIERLDDALMRCEVAGWIHWRSGSLREGTYEVFHDPALGEYGVKRVDTP